MILLLCNIDMRFVIVAYPGPFYELFYDIMPNLYALANGSCNATSNWMKSNFGTVYSAIYCHKPDIIIA